MSAPHRGDCIVRLRQQTAWPKQCPGHGGPVEPNSRAAPRIPPGPAAWGTASALHGLPAQRPARPPGPVCRSHFSSRAPWSRRLPCAEWPSRWQ